YARRGPRPREADQPLRTDRGLGHARHARPHGGDARRVLTAPAGTKFQGWISVTNSATAADDMTPVAIHVRVRLTGPLTRPFMIFRSDPSSTISTRSGGATSPLMIAATNSARMGSTPS